MIIKTVRMQKTKEDRSVQEIVEETNESLRTSIMIAHQTNQLAADTMLELHSQGDQISNMERDLEQIEENNKKADRHIRGIRSFFGSLVNRFSSPSLISPPLVETHQKPPQPPSVQPISQHSMPILHDASNNSFNNSSNNSFNPFDSNYIDANSYEDTMRQQDKNLDELLNALVHMNNAAQSMNIEITDQNQRLDKVAEKTQKQNAEIQKHNFQINKLLK